MSNIVEGWDSLLLDDHRFFASIASNFVGWLDDFAALRTLDILSYQEKKGYDGSLYEVGLYHGKYFALLVRSAAITNSTVVGIDCFDYVPEEQYLSQFESIFRLKELQSIRPFKLSVLNNYSTRLSFRDMSNLLGADARFMSIDGSHEYDDVLWDLSMAERLMSPAGVISADDYLNPICLGVTAAIDKFIDSHVDVVPFAYICNKLFICRPHFANEYRNLMEKCILSDEGPKGKAFKENADDNHRRNIEASYKGNTILTVRL